MNVAEPRGPRAQLAHYQQHPALRESFRGQGQRAELPVRSAHGHILHLRALLSGPKKRLDCGALPRSMRLVSGKNAASLVSRRTVLAITAPHCALYAARAPAVPQSARIGRTVVHFEQDRFVDDCVAASRESDSQRAVQEVLERAIDDADGVLARLGAPRQAGIDVLHRSPTLTIFAARWAPRMSLPAHDHRMWALIGLYTGREDNIYWRRMEDRLQAHH